MKTIGIIGGMGPLATADLYTALIEHADAARDQDHPHVIIDSHPQIPDRTSAILFGGEDPIPLLTASAKRLELAGAEVLGMACNTAHHYYEAIAASVGIPLLHMPREVASEANLRGCRHVALLATDGTIRTGIYHQAFEEAGIRLSTPDETGQQAVMDLIYKGVKAGASDFDTAAFSDCLAALRQQGISAFVLGCTELPPAFKMYGFQAPILDSTDILALALLRQSNCKIRGESSGSIEKAADLIGDFTQTLEVFGK